MEKLSSAEYQKLMLALVEVGTNATDLVPPMATGAVPLRAWMALLPSSPAATTNATPESWAKSSSARSSTAVPSCAPLCDPHELLITTGLPSSDALAMIHAHASTAPPVDPSCFTTRSLEAGTAPLFPAAMLATCVP